MTPSIPNRRWPSTRALIVLTVGLGGYYLVLPYGQWAAAGYVATLLVLASTIRAFLVGAKFELPVGASPRWRPAFGRLIRAALDSGETDGD